MNQVLFALRAGHCNSGMGSQQCPTCSDSSLNVPGLLLSTFKDTEVVAADIKAGKIACCRYRVQRFA
jgi:hypothetical protein